MPANNVEACLEEIDRSIDTLGARGIQLFTNVLGKPLSLPEFRPIFRRMAEHDLPVWIHPIRGPNSADYATEKASENEIWFTFGWPYETTACVTRLIFSGLYDELPGLKIITHHYCGMVPFYAGKIQLGFDQIFFGTSQKNPQAEKAGLRRRADGLLQDDLRRHRAERRGRGDALRPRLLRRRALGVRHRRAFRRRGRPASHPQHARGRSMRWRFPERRRT